MSRAVKVVFLVLIFAATSSAQQGLSVRSNGKQKWPAAEAQKIYVSACSAVQREFGSKRPLAPQITLVLGAERDEVWFSGREVRLTRWNREVFAQGVVWLAFVDLMPSQQRLTIAQRAANWANSTVEVEQLKK